MPTIEERLLAIEARLGARCLPEKGPGGGVFGTVLRQRRKARNLSMRVVWEAGGPSIAQQSEVERGKQKNVPLLRLIRWCEAIGCDPVEVFQDILAAVKQGEEKPDA